MSRIQMSLINNDFQIRAAADIDLSDVQNLGFSEFLERLQEDLDTGETAWLEIQGMSRPVRISVAQSA